MRAQFPNDKDIILCKAQNSCYVKGRLQPTRSLGDYHLKLKSHYQGTDSFNGPYISNQPEIQVHELNPTDSYIVMASDGLWDVLNETNIANIVLSADNDNENNKNQ